MTVLLYVLGVIIFVAGILVSIALHELGHLHYAKKYGCRVSQYMIGFGPTLWSKQIGETEYGIKLIPLGGYVKIIGMLPPAQQCGSRRTELPPANGEQLGLEGRQTGRSRAVDSQVEVEGSGEASEQTIPLRLRKSNTGLFAQMVSETRSAEFELVRPEDESRLFYKLPWYRKAMVMFAGPAVNIGLAFVCFLGVYSLYGDRTVTESDEPVVDSVSDCVIPSSESRFTCQEQDPISPSRKAGLRVGDRITAFNSSSVSTWDELGGLIEANGSESATLLVERDGKQLELHTKTVTLRRDVSADGVSGEFAEVGFLGIGPKTSVDVHRGGVLFTMGRMGEMTAHSVQSIATMPKKVWNVAMAVTGHEQRSADSPISIVGGSRFAGEVASSDLPGLGSGDKMVLLVLILGGFNLFVGLFNLVPLLPLDGGHIAGALWEAARRGLYRLHKWPDPGYVDVARQMPVAYCLGIALLTMGVILIVGDVVVPLQTGL